MKLLIITFTVSFAALITSSSIPRPGFPEEDIVRGRIINGKYAEIGEAPYIVSLTTTTLGSHFCGGSILNESWIITAAHCVDGGSIFIHAGLHDRNEKTDGQTIRVDDIFVHEEYSGGVGPYDIALLHLEKPLQMNQRVQSIELPNHDAQQKGNCTLFGWGRDNSGGLPNILKTVTTDLLQYKECSVKLPYNAPVHETNICSGSRNQGISACNGDSGGPLTQKIEDKTVLVGIVSWGYIPCGQLNYPSVYTYTGAYIDWIKNKQKLYELL